MIHRRSGHAACICMKYERSSVMSRRQRETYEHGGGLRGDSVMWRDRVKVRNSRRHRAPRASLTEYLSKYSALLSFQVSSRKCRSSHLDVVLALRVFGFL
ncbi:hypothetical protein DY000_02007412 [Brassica cretica]|uniref:Uncharacterized protein n=1 Tax=Brassica cretica TaxID=69181 RepID=A0ABQ7CIA1_BRACR|nr:hypothetical protein DY000_02007412 [Brassica cretica]